MLNTFLVLFQIFDASEMDLVPKPGGSGLSPGGGPSSSSIPNLKLSQHHQSGSLIANLKMSQHQQLLQQQQQQQLSGAANRRTKKRPSYGMRTVELIRGHTGFGFTLSGQGPCILSNILPESPASRAMLRSGDHVIAVNGKNVSKSGHDEVVKLIGNSTGVLKLQVRTTHYIK